MNKNLNHNLMFTSFPDEAMKIMSDEEVLEHLKEAHNNGWDINTSYGPEYSCYNALHACCMTIKKHYKSAQWLLEKGINPNTHSGNENTAFTFFLSALPDEPNIEEVLNFCNLLKKHGADLSFPGYDNESALELYNRYNNKLQQPILDFIIENTDFTHNFLLGELFKIPGLFTFNNLKKILQHHDINLKKVYDEDENNANAITYWDNIANSLIGSYWKSSYEKITWLHNKLGFDLDTWHTFNEFGINGDKEYYINLLGKAIYNKNSNMFNWVIKRKPEQINDKFYINNKQYGFLEFCLVCDFRKGVKLALKNMDKDELMSLNMPKLKKLCQHSEIPKTLETLEKTYTHLMYKYMRNKYENVSSSGNKEKKLKI